MSDGSLEFQNLPLFISLWFSKDWYVIIHQAMLVPKVFRLNTFIFMIILLLINEVDLDLAFVHPFHGQEFLIKLLTASGKFLIILYSCKTHVTTELLWNSTEIKPGICSWDMKRDRSIFTWNFSAFKIFLAPLFIQWACATKRHTCKTLSFGYGYLTYIHRVKNIHIDSKLESITNFIHNRKYSSVLKALRFEDTFDDGNETSFQKFSKYLNHP